MSARTSKEVTDRQKSCQFLLTALHGQGPRIAELLAERMRPFLAEGDLVPTEQVLHIALSRILDANMAATVRADEAIFKAEADLSALREERNEATRQLRQLIIRLRTIVEGHYRSPLLEHLGMGTRTSRYPVPLLRQAARIAEAFASEELQALLGAPFVAGEEPPQETVVELTAQGTALRGLLLRFDEAVRLRDAARVEKYEHLMEHDLLYTYSARTFEAFCRLAGKAELAERVRRSIRRSRQEEPEVENGEGEETEEPPAEEEPPFPEPEATVSE